MRPFEGGPRLRASRDGLHVALLDGKRFALYAAATHALTAATEIAAATDGAVGFLGGGTHLVASCVVGDETQVTAYTVPSLTPVALLAIPGRWWPQVFVGQRFLVTSDGPSAPCIATLTTRLYTDPIALREPLLLAFATPDDQMLLATRTPTPQLELWDPMVRRAVERRNLRLPPRPFAGGFAARRRLLWILAAGTPGSLDLFRFSDGRQQLRIDLRSPVVDAHGHPDSPRLVLGTRAAANAPLVIEAIDFAAEKRTTLTPPEPALAFCVAEGLEPQLVAYHGDGRLSWTALERAMPADVRLTPPVRAASSVPASAAVATEAAAEAGDDAAAPGATAATGAPAAKAAAAPARKPTGLAALVGAPRRTPAAPSVNAAASAPAARAVVAGPVQQTVAPSPAATPAMAKTATPATPAAALPGLAAAPSLARPSTPATTTAGPRAGAALTPPRPPAARAPTHAGEDWRTRLAVLPRSGRADAVAPDVDAAADAPPPADAASPDAIAQEADTTAPDAAVAAQASSAHAVPALHGAFAASNAATALNTAAEHNVAAPNPAAAPDAAAAANSAATYATAAPNTAAALDATAAHNAAAPNAPAALIAADATWRAALCAWAEALLGHGDWAQPTPPLEAGTSLALCVARFGLDAPATRALALSYGAWLLGHGANGLPAATLARALVACDDDAEAAWELALGRGAWAPLVQPRRGRVRLRRLTGRFLDDAPPPDGTAISDAADALLDARLRGEEP